MVLNAVCQKGKLSGQVRGEHVKIMTHFVIVVLKKLIVLKWKGWQGCGHPDKQTWGKQENAGMGRHEEKRGMSGQF